MAREYIDELGDGTINPETSGVDSQATDNGTHVKTLAPIYYTPATIANDGKATRETPVTIKSALDAKQNALAFDGTTTTKALTQKGTFESFAKSGDITTAINTLDGSVVHINGNETIHDNKYFDGSLNMTLGNNRSTGVFMLGAVDSQPIYSDWTEAQKDGHHHREWTLAFPSNTSITTAAGTIRLTLYGGYYGRNVMNPLSKTINLYLSLGADPVQFGSNLGYYNQLGGTIEDEFRISDIIWDSANSRPVIKIRNVMPEKNNYVLFVIIEYTVINYQTRDWIRQLSWVSTSPTIVEDSQYFTRRSGNVTTEETTSNGQFFNWADKPVLQGPYGDEIQYNWVGTSYTGASDATKTVTIPSFQAVTGSKAVVFFSYANTANNPKLNISGTGAKDIFFNGTKITTSLSNSILKGAILFIYDGTQYHIIGGSSPGINAGIQLTSSDNLNDIQASQLGEISTYYWLYTQCPTNAPLSDKSCVMVLYGTSTNTDKYRVQVAYYGDGGIYQRTQDNNVWSDWSKMLTASDITASTNNGKIKVTGTDVTVYTHPAGSAASKTGVPTANATPAFGGTFKVNQITTDATSHVSSVTERTITIPNTTGNASTAGLTKLYTATGTNTDGTMTQNAIKTALDGKVSSIKKNGSTITPSDGVADIGYMPVTEVQTTATVQEVIQALRVKPGGRMGSVNILESTVGTTTIPSSWYNYLWIPHLAGAPIGDSQHYGTLIFTPLTTTPDVYMIEGSNLHTSSPTYRIKRLDAVTAEAAIATGDKLLFSDEIDGNKAKRMSTGFDTDVTTTMLRRDGTFAKVLYADEGWGGSFRTSLSPFDNYAFKSANCFFGAKPSAIAVEYSNDGGTTWTDYGCTDEQKVKLFSQYDGCSVYCGHNMHIHPGYTGTIAGTKDLSNENIANQRLRITICDSSLANVGTTSTTDQWIYCNIRRFGIYMSTQSASGGAHCLVEYRTRDNFRSNTDTWVSVGDFKIQGDSGWNSIPANNAKSENKITFGNNQGSHAKEFRFTIWSDQLSATPAASSTGNMLINRIVAYSELLWSNSSSRTAIGYYGSPCTVDPVSGTLNLGKAKFTARELSVDLSSTSTTATSFDGTANVSIKNTGTLPVSKGGTGRNSVTAGSYLVGNDTGALTQKTAVEVAHNVLTSLPSGTTDNVLGTDYIISSNHIEGATDATKFVRRTADKLWNYIKDRISSVLGLTATNYGGNAATATTATNYNTSSGNIKTELEGKSSTSHTHSVSINGSTKTIAASGGTAVDLGTYKVFNYARVYTTQTYNANTNRYIMLAFNAATYTSNWEESSMFKLEVHDGLLPKELVFRLWIKGNAGSDPSNPKLYRVYSENFSESALNILDVRLFVVERSAESIQFTIGIFIDRNYLQGQYISYQLYPLSYGTRDRGNTIDNGLSNWTYTVGHDVYRSNNQHSVFTTAFEVNDLTVNMNISGNAATATKATGDADGNNIKNSYMQATSGTKALAFGSSTQIGTVSGSAVNVSLPSLPSKGSSTRPIYIDSNGFPQVVGMSTAHPTYLNLNVVTSHDAAHATDADTVDGVHMHIGYSAAESTVCFF